MKSIQLSRSTLLLAYSKPQGTLVMGLEPAKFKIFFLLKTKSQAICPILALFFDLSTILTIFSRCFQINSQLHEEVEIGIFNH
jgi:hypothetical protein